MRPLIAAAILALAAPALAQAPAPSPTPAVTEWRALDPGNTLVVDTTKGRIVVEMHPEIAPLAVERIKTLAKRGYYDGSLFYRVLKDFMAQGGDKGSKAYRSDLPDIRGEFTFRREAATPFALVGTQPNAEVGFTGVMPVRFEKFSDGSQQGWVWFCPGVASMPHYDDPNTANSQLFFIRRHATNLEKTFTAWGRVVFGQEVVDALNNGEPPPSPDKMTRVSLLADLPEAERPKLEVMDTRAPAFSALSSETMKARGSAFSLCDLKVPTRPTP